MGARLGINAIPPSWRDRVGDSDYLHALGKRLWQNAVSDFPDHEESSMRKRLDQFRIQPQLQSSPINIQSFGSSTVVTLFGGVDH